MAIVKGIEFLGMSPELQQRVQNGITVHVGDTLDVAQLRSELQDIDEHLMMAYSVSGAYDWQRADVILRITLRPDGTTSPAVSAVGGYRIGGGVSAPVPTFRADPEYSEEARKAKWQGAVLLQVVIDENGVPQNIQVVRPLGMGLDQKAIEAVQKWRFKPGLKDGQPVPVAAVMEVNFRLLQSPQ
jgi:TonB family protein